METQMDLLPHEFFSFVEWEVRRLLAGDAELSGSMRMSCCDLRRADAILRRGAGRGRCVENARAARIHGDDVCASRAGRRTWRDLEIRDLSQLLYTAREAGVRGGVRWIITKRANDLADADTLIREKTRRKNRWMISAGRFNGGASGDRN